MRKYIKVLDHENEKYDLVPDSSGLTFKAYRFKPIRQANKNNEYNTSMVVYVAVACFYYLENKRVMAMTSAAEFHDAFMEWLETHEIDYPKAFDADGNQIIEMPEYEKRETDPLQ